MMQHFEAACNAISTGRYDIIAALPLNKNTRAKLLGLARMRLGVTTLRVRFDTFQREYEGGVPLEDIAQSHGVTVPYAKDVVRAFGLTRDAGAAYRAGFKSVWNAGLTKEDDQRLLALSEARSGEGNPAFGKRAWNAGKTAASDPGLARISGKLTGRTVSKETRRRQALAKMGRCGSASNRWKGGRKVGGYVVTTSRHYEHRLIAERLLGRKLARSEHVHHKDRDRTNNDPANMIVLHQADHACLHGAMNKNPNLDQIGWLQERGMAFEELGKCQR